MARPERSGKGGRGRSCILPSVDRAHGGRLVLRIVDTGGAAIEYAGEIATAAGEWPVRFRISASDGKVEPSAEATHAAPHWLVEFAVATLRAAWRAHRETGRWPRRLQRWRPGPEREEQ